MDLRKRITFTRFYFIFVFLFTFVCCINAENSSSNNSEKSLIIQEIMKKVSNLTSGVISKAPHETKEIILNKIENKLRKSANIIGPDADKYISFLMKQFKAKMNESITVKGPEHIQDVKEVKEEIIIRRTKAEDNKPRETFDSETKKEIIKEIANKIQTLAKGFMKNANTKENKQQILEKIKKKVMDSTKQKHIQLQNTQAEIKVYTSLIAQGIEESMRKMLEIEAVGRRMSSQVLPKPEELSEELIVVKDRKPEKSTKVDENILKNKSMVVMDLVETDKYRDLISQSLNGTSPDQSCEKIVEATCLGIQKVNQIQCDEGIVIPVESLCNNVSDCLNGVDEKNCAAQAMEQVRIATRVMSDVEASLSHTCFAIPQDNLLISQNQVLRDLLQTQMDFLKKHLQTTFQIPGIPNEVLDEDFVKATVNDVTKIISSLSYSLDGRLCARISDPEHQGNSDIRKFNDIEVDKMVEVSPFGWYPKSCECAGQFCKDPPTCPSACKRVCWQKYSLNHWGCQTLNRSTAVSLNVLCDGKLDCFDETDESFCVIDVTSSKFEAAKSYNNLLDFLATKSKSMEFITSRTKFLALHNLVRKLQKQTIRTNIDSHTIKTLRDQAFNLLVSIYDDLKETVKLDELEDHYYVLFTISEKLVTALKSSHMGNENLVSPEGCYCRGGLCALRRCTKHCIQACLAEPWLTQFECNDVKNLTIPIELVCNGKKNCPKEEDEKNCSKEICRGHHIMMLRHNLENIGVKHKGSVMGEVIESWKVKVSAALVVAETGQRTTHKVLVEILHSLLHDLVMAFAAMEDSKRSNSDYALQEFKGIAKIVMQTLKSCTN